MQLKAIHKAKQIFLLSFNYLVPVFATGYIIMQLMELKETSGIGIHQIHLSMSIDKISIYLDLIFLSILNCSIEGFKWQLSVTKIQVISFSTAIKQTLIGSCGGILTPARTGDYIAKLVLFPKNKRPFVLALNAVNNLLQLAVTCLLGGVSLFAMFATVPELASYFSLNTLFIAILIFASGILIVWLVFKYWITNIYNELKTSFSLVNCSLGLQLFGLSVLRYLTFSTQFVFVLWLLGCNTPLYIRYITISSLYLINSVIPSSAISDVVIKGSLGVFLFSAFEVPASIVLSATAFMWVLNHIIPALIGSYLLFKTKLMSSEQL